MLTFLFSGLLFCIGSVSCLFVWIGWVTAFMLFDDRLDPIYQNITICCGLVATPTVLLLVIFIPKVDMLCILLCTLFRDTPILLHKLPYFTGVCRGSRQGMTLLLYNLTVFKLIFSVFAFVYQHFFLKKMPNYLLNISRTSGSRLLYPNYKTIHRKMFFRHLYFNF